MCDGIEIQTVRYFVPIEGSGVVSWGYTAPRGYVVVSGGFNIDLNGGSVIVRNSAITQSNPSGYNPGGGFDSEYGFLAEVDTTGGTPSINVNVSITKGRMGLSRIWLDENGLQDL